jgi:para-nitrobenzyl esterase
MARLGLSERQTAAYRSLLPDAPPWRVLARATTDQMFRLNAARLADARQSAVAPTFAYDFRWPSPALGGFGACHCLDLPFVFDNLDADGVETVAGPGTPQELADRMHRAWVGFIADGDPGWDRYEPPRRAVMVFDADPGPVKEVVDDPLRAEREIWSGA